MAILNGIKTVDMLYKFLTKADTTFIEWMRRYDQAIRKNAPVIPDLIETVYCLCVGAIKQQHMTFSDGSFSTRDEDDPFLFGIGPYVHVMINIIMIGKRKDIIAKGICIIDEFLGGQHPMGPFITGPVPDYVRMQIAL